jgi:hypothetical protein
VPVANLEPPAAQNEHRISAPEVAAPPGLPRALARPREVLGPLLLIPTRSRHVSSVWYS